MGRAYMLFNIFLMRLSKQKQQPFFVKRVRLRKSIIKTNQILQTISNYELQTSKFSTISSFLPSQQLQLREKKCSMPLNRSTIDEFQLYTAKSTRLKLKNMNNIIKMCNDQKNKAVVMEMSRAGLEARRIVGDFSQTRRYHCSSEEQRSKKKRQQSCSRMTNIALTNEAFEPDLIIQCSSPKKELSSKQGQRSLVKCSTALTPSRRNRIYLYQKMAQMENAPTNQQNHIYQKRIKSYTQFLWKCMLAHNVYLDLDLEPSTVTNKKYKPCKAYIGCGNNSNMIKSLLKRRFWWSLSEEFSEDCVFAWTQIKINKIFERQQRAPINVTAFNDQTVVAQNMQDFRSTQSSNLKKRTRENNLLSKRKENQQFNHTYASHHKVWNLQDFTFMKPFFKQKEFRLNCQAKQGKELSYHMKNESVKKKYKSITKIDMPEGLDQEQNDGYYRVRPLMHNHLQNNFYLGNKKALFYNMREYYEKRGEDVFNYLPLTFHIKSGFKDPEYKRFTEFYDSRAKLIKKQLKNEGERQKARNIWIVKPGQNSNQGRGITVIDEIYELDRIIKQSHPNKPKQHKNPLQSDPQGSTFIVQLYIDRPLLYNQRKFDIRHYMLMTNLFGVTRAYWYQEGYIRTSSYNFNIHRFDPEIHLTNDAIQKHYPQYGRHEPANKVSYSEFQNYLDTLSERCNFKEDILPKMKQMGRDAARSVFPKINHQNQMHNFQIFGLDFMVDRQFKPWLIEINTNPCLECVCPLLERIIPYMVEQSLKLSIDIVYPPPTHYPNTAKHYAPLINLDNFKYQLIFDSLSEGPELERLWQKSSNLASNIGLIEEDEQFNDEGREIKLQDFT